MYFGPLYIQEQKFTDTHSLQCVCVNSGQGFITHGEDSNSIFKVLPILLINSFKYFFIVWYSITHVCYLSHEHTSLLMEFATFFGLHFQAVYRTHICKKGGREGGRAKKNESYSNSQCS